MIKKIISQEELLSREASMSAMALGHGLTQLRKYDFGQTGYFYSSLLQITTGIERLLKLIIIYTHRIDHNKFPDNKELRKYGHDIKVLFLKSIEIASRNDCGDIAKIFSEDEIFEKIITLLSDFAMQARYYNLDVLTGRHQKNIIEPLVRWETEINSIIVKRHFRRRKRTLENWEMVINALESKTAVRHTSEDGTPLNSFREMAEQGMKVSTKQKYSMYYVYVIIRYLTKLLIYLEDKGSFFPFLQEYFVIYRDEDRSEILRKKSWNPLQP
ncbi:MAG TPA: hypothetical protein DDY32_08525 [Desulfobulbaceae bacterium]|nr:hypothetical protein [Desulfobulbaceae bacterium]